ncbi:hypothetical protein NQ315_015782 [Exocentrus adspersus]|uniref:Methylcrotonoyl-CoA carboxylase subunit alpha, mitochondrial n=1 Tax=Exocentrus adspersus TaxID=1586481 RepID=A0AAV8W2U9_9CUCU|nr:hypothetical protein NQ315_015782 [Exocentrus adspersus]
MKSHQIGKLLIANRGEIACRVMRTAKRMGIRTVGVFSDVDKNALHVSMADEAYLIGPASAAHSYLRGDKLLHVAKKSKCQAIHPGYGFLSENAEFAEDCCKEGIIFVGPPASAIRDMGIKSTSKEIMSTAGVPVIEGYHGQDQSNDTLKNAAKRIGFPVMIKAVRGGGGKGMRISYSDSDFEENLESARSESQKAFGNSDVLLEKFITQPRHVEVQVFADMHGNAVHLFERDCSVQRRHQKIIEEAPAPGLSSGLRNELGEAAVRAAKAVGYVGAGTVEFILDKNDHSFHFMEMNTRLQVEHPITEMITGTDLVEWQLKVASGEKLPVSQKDITMKGHAFEARIYAEDPSQGFLPGAGPLLHLSTPESSEEVRIETGVREGDEVSVHYDPMIAKLVVWGTDRSEALSKLQANLVNYNIAGVETNVNFFIEPCEASRVLCREHRGSLLQSRDEPEEKQLLQATLVIILKDQIDEVKEAESRHDEWNPFIVESNFRVNQQLKRDVRLRFKDKEFMIKVQYGKDKEYHMSYDAGKSWNVVQGNIACTRNRSVLNYVINGDKSRINFFIDASFVAVFNQEGKVQFTIPQPSYEETDESLSEPTNAAVAPMPGVLDKLLVKPGDVVAKGDALFVLIAMKMEYIVRASNNARVSGVLFKAGDTVQKDATVVQMEENIE